MNTQLSSYNKQRKIYSKLKHKCKTTTERQFGGFWIQTQDLNFHI